MLSMAHFKYGIEWGVLYIVHDKRPYLGPEH